MAWLRSGPDSYRTSRVVDQFDAISEALENGRAEPRHDSVSCCDICSHRLKLRADAVPLYCRRRPPCGRGRCA